MKKLNYWVKGVALAVLLAISATANAATVSFTNLTNSEYESIAKELSSNFYYTTVSGASSLGKTFGFEFGVVAGVSKIPDILALVKRNDPNTSLKDDFVHGNILARLTTPFYGLTVEASAIPTINASDAKFSQWGGAVMWTITDVLLTDLPVSLATKAYYKKTNFEYGQTISSVPATVSLDNSLYGIQAFVSKKFLDLVEPYVGVGYTKANADLSISSTNALASIFASGLTGASSSPSSAQVMAGADLQLAFFTVGAEYARTYSRSSYTGRVSFRF